MRIFRSKTGQRLLAVVVLAILLSVLTGIYLSRAGARFFLAGQQISQTLEALSIALQARDLDAVRATYADTFAGSDLGLTNLRLRDDRDGVRTYAFAADQQSQDAAAAAAAWDRYLQGLESVDEVRLHVHRLHRWRGDELEASVRFEVVGMPRGEARAGIDRAYFQMKLRPAGEAGLRIVSAELLEGDRVISSEPQFVDTAADAGIAFENQYYPPFLSEPLKFGMLRYGPAGITTTDLDGDGLHDLFIPDGVESRLYRNVGDGTFEDITAAAGLSGLDGVSVGLFADWDNDGDKDFFVSRTFQPNQLFENQGDGTFRDVTERAGLGADCCTTVGSFGDIDNDGDLDLYVGRYLDPRERIPTTFYARNGEHNQLYRNNGDGTFSNITESAGVGEVGLCLGSVFGDYDQDGDADLYVVNDFGRKTLYRNDGTGSDGDVTFTDVTVATGTLAYGAGMSASFGDYDNDGWQDIYVAHIRSESSWFAEWPTVGRYMLNTWTQGVWMSDMPLYMQIARQSGFGMIEVFQQMASGNTLLRNRGDGTFEDVTWAANANPPGWFWGSGFADFDNDGWQDIYSVNGWVYNQPGTEIEQEFLHSVVNRMQEYKEGTFFDPAYFGERSWHGFERNRHLRNRGDGTFEEIGRAAGTDLLLNSRGTAFADFWNRGVVDIAVAASTDRHALLRNQVGLQRNFLQVELVGAAGDLPNGSNRDAVGARVTLRQGESQQLREVALGDGYASQNSLRLHFGLGGTRRFADAASSSEPNPSEPNLSEPVAAAPIIDELIVYWPRSGHEQRFTQVLANRIVRIVEGRDELELPDYPSQRAADDAAELEED